MGIELSHSFRAPSDSGGRGVCRPCFPWLGGGSWGRRVGQIEELVCSSSSGFGVSPSSCCAVGDGELLGLKFSADKQSEDTKKLSQIFFCGGLVNIIFAIRVCGRSQTNITRKVDFMMKNVSWMPCRDGNTNVWCKFKIFEVDHHSLDDVEGVYIIWSENNSFREAVRIGQGIIQDRIKAHRKNKEITAHSNLLVTWAKVPRIYMDGVERFLADELSPVVGGRFPKADPIEVNLPW